MTNTMYSVVLEDTRSKGSGPVHRSPQSPEKLVSVLEDDCDTLYKVFFHGKELSKNGKCLGTRSRHEDGTYGGYEWMTYGEVEETYKRFGSGLIKIGAVFPCKEAPENPSDVAGSHMLGLFSVNRKEWIIAEEACNAYSLVSVPLYDTLGEGALEFILKQTELESILCSNDLLDKILDLPETHLRNVISMDGITDDEKKQLQDKGFQVYTFEQVADLGEENLLDPIPPTSDHLATICYTSGTTGNPKGVMMLHRNIVADCAGALLNGYDLCPSDVYLSYLPLAHMFERTVIHTGLFRGASAGFFRGNVREHLMDDIAVLRPTVFASVPRLLNRVYDKVMSKIRDAPKLKRMLFHYAYKSKRYYLNHFNTVHHFVWDHLVFNKIRERLGGRVRLLASGSAPLSAEVLEFLRICFSCAAVQGYGLSETSAAATLGLPRDMSTTGHVGGPLACVEMKLVDVEDMDYKTDSTPERGEVCVRGPAVTPGYFKDPERTAEGIDDEKWLHTGDIGEWQPSGALRIIDRIKNMFKLAQGEYVAAEKIEEIYCRAPSVAQCFVYGDSEESFLVAIIVPDHEELVKRIKQDGDTKLASDSLENLVQREEVKTAIQKDLDNIGKEAKLRGFEKAKDIFVTSEEFTIENGLLTPSFKLKRPQARDKFRKEISELYSKNRK